MDPKKRDPGPLERLLDGYKPSEDAADELVAPDGKLRPVWSTFLDRFSAYSGKDVAQRFHRAQQYLHDAGVFYREYDDGASTERAWPLSPFPVLLSETDWAEITEGLTQRADLLEEVLADLYGPGHLVRDGHLPAQLVAAMPEWLRPMVGIRPRSGHFLHFIAFEIGRGPDGKWWVLGDRAQAPTGAGFAIENRVAMSRMLPEIFAEANIARLGGFFNDYRAALEALNPQGAGRIGVLTPGLMSQGYFEHAYIARYLGFMLLEGDDMVVRDGRVMVRTVDGLQPIDVLWRRLDASWADPLELDEASRLGTPGLVGALRRQSLDMVNALGSGVLETRAFLAFMPRICEALRQEPLKMPNIATWWCGQEVERAHVKANTARMMIGRALGTRLPFDEESLTVLGGQFRGAAGPSVEDWIETEGAALVGQEVVRLSTTPAYHEGKLVPRPMSLRVFAARTVTGGWTFLPGGYARIGRGAASTAISLQQGGTVADVWLVRNSTPEETPVSDVSHGLGARGDLNLLPSRAADNLYWLGRYVERAEGTMRLLRAYHVRLSENAAPEMPLLRAIASNLSMVGVEAGAPLPAGLLSMIDAAVRSAAHVRDRFSVDGWLALKELQATAGSLAREFNQLQADGELSHDDVARDISGLIRQVTGFSGLVQDNMYRFTGWRFLSIGRALERALEVCTMLAEFADPAAAFGALDLAVELGDSGITHRRRYAITTSRDTVVDLLALDARNPRALLYQLNLLRRLCSELPGAEFEGRLAEFYRAAIRVQTDVELHTVESLKTADLWSLRAALAGVSDQLSLRFFQ